MTTIATFTVPEEAHLFRTFLESRGIEGFVFDENVVQLFWHYSNAIGGVRVAVDEDDVEDAFTAYQEYMAALRDRPYPEATGPHLACGSPVVAARRRAAARFSAAELTNRKSRIETNRRRDAVVSCAMTITYPHPNPSIRPAAIRNRACACRSPRCASPPRRSPSPRRAGKC